ncbi:MAG: CIA30 family protein [Cyanobacteriota bacterium]
MAVDTHLGDLLIAGDDFASWSSLNDTIMGGRSQSRCSASAEGLRWQGQIISEGGGFISCRSPQWRPPLDLSGSEALVIRLLGDGRRYKIALACADLITGLSAGLPGGLRWVHGFNTQDGVEASITIPFTSLRPSVQARPLGLPLRFQPKRIERIQLLHSRFDDDGGTNPGYRAGDLDLLIRSFSIL